MAADDNRPFAMLLDVEFLDRLSEPVRQGHAKSVSEIIRAALLRFDAENVIVVHPPQLLISVRLPSEVRENLRRVAREKHTSVGQLVRSAVESYLPELERAGAGQLEMPMAIESPAPSSETPPSFPRAAAKKSRKKKAKPAPRRKSRKPAKPARRRAKR
jgi:Arc/MetJ-type ribon-helix-helix transcriptional regulator